MVPGSDNLVFRGNTGGGNHRSARRKVFTQTFIAGAQNLLGVGLIIGIARGATLILDKGEISGTILHYLSGRVEHVPRRRVHRRAFLRLRRAIDLYPIIEWDGRADDADYERAGRRGRCVTGGNRERILLRNWLDGLYRADRFGPALARNGKCALRQMGAFHLAVNGSAGGALRPFSRARGFVAAWLVDVSSEEDVDESALSGCDFPKRR